MDIQRHKNPQVYFSRRAKIYVASVEMFNCTKEWQSNKQSDKSQAEKDFYTGI